MHAATDVPPVARPDVVTPMRQDVQLEAPEAEKLPGPHSRQNGPYAYVPAEHKEQEIGTPRNHTQLLSLELRTRLGVLQVPSEPA